MSTPIEDHKQWLESRAAALLEPYTARLAERAAGTRTPKEFNDPVWGTILLYPLEVAILDSPLLQRLRGIRQLGVVHFVYPAAVHTRFEHAIGAVHEVDRLLTSINAHAAGGDAVVPRELVQVLRLTALCHDVGHGLMSHVSENACAWFASCRSLRAEFVDTIQEVDKASLSEIAAYYLLGSPAFRNLVDAVRGRYPEHMLPADAVDQMQRAIVAAPISTSIPLLHELISGPFDADKLDYMTRDAYMSGVPVVTDVPRLVQKARAAEKARDELPADMLERVGSAPSYQVIGLSLSGARTLDELMLGRILLFDKLYRHQKVRAAEAMVTAIFRLLAHGRVAQPEALPYLFSDDELLNATAEGLKAITTGEVDEQQNESIKRAAVLASDMRERRLWVRAFAFSQNMPLDPYRAESEHSQGLTRLITTLRHPPEREALATRIAEGVVKIAELLGEHVQVSPDALAHLDERIVVDPPKGPPEPNDLAYLITDDDQIMRFGDEYAETANWVKAYHLTRDVGYVFAPIDVAPLVYISTERLFRDEYGIRAPDVMMSYARRDATEIRRLKRRLEATGYYDTSAFDLRPLTDRLLRGDVQARVDGIVSRLEGYRGPVRQSEILGKATLNHRDRVLTWLHQFRAEEHVDAALRMLERMKLIGREVVVTEIARFFEGKGAEFSGSIFCRFGEPKDSSSVVTYYVNDLSELYDMRALDLEDALQVRSPVVFTDDFIGSGSQSVTIVERWLGVENSVELGEDRGEPLSRELQDALRSRPTAFVFAAGSPEGAERFEGRVRELGLDATVHVGVTSDLPKAFEGEEAPGEEFKDLCRDVGLSLLDDGRHDEGWRQERALGYGNDAYLVVFDYNTPSQSLTCLWADGYVAGVPWTPLYPRRKKR